MINNFRGEYRFLSNFFPAPVTYRGLTYKNNEAAFQAQKDLSRLKEFTQLDPSAAKRLGRRVRLRSDWEEVKLDIMEDIVRAKFTQNQDLAQKLLNTYPQQLVEGNNWNDTFWGVCRGKGNNALGLILMVIRNELQNKGG